LQDQSVILVEDRCIIPSSHAATLPGCAGREQRIVGTLRPVAALERRITD
jgi:hypothetical protein